MNVASDEESAFSFSSSASTMHGGFVLFDSTRKKCRHAADNPMQMTRNATKYAKQYPFADLVTHEFGLDQADEAMQMSMSPQSGKVVINPWL